jgi:hypothetical protein
MGLFSSKDTGGKAERPIVLESRGGKVEIGATDSRGRYQITVSDKRTGQVELRLTGTGDRHSDAQAFAAEYAKDGGTLRRRP